MNAKHTPGPWRVMEHKPFKVAAGKQLDIVRAMSKTIWVDENRKVQSRVIPLAERNANAVLVAAAPELLEALKRMKSMYELMMKKIDHANSFYDAETITEMNEAPVQAARAIRKAEGGAQ